MKVVKKHFLSHQGGEEKKIVAGGVKRFFFNSLPQLPSPPPPDIKWCVPNMDRTSPGQKQKGTKTKYL